MFEAILSWRDNGVTPIKCELQLEPYMARQWDSGISGLQWWRCQLMVMSWGQATLWPVGVEMSSAATRNLNVRASSSSSCHSLHHRWPRSVTLKSLKQTARIQPKIESPSAQQPRQHCLPSRSLAQNGKTNMNLIPIPNRSALPIENHLTKMAPCGSVPLNLNSRWWRPDQWRMPSCTQGCLFHRLQWHSRPWNHHFMSS